MKTLPKEPCLGLTYSDKAQKEFCRQNKANAIAKQFPDNEKLPDGRNRFYIKNGQLVQRS